MQSKIQGCLYIILHMQCQMQEMQKGNIHMCYKGAPTHQLINDRLLEGRQKGLDTTDKGAKERKTHKLPLNTCTRAKKHTKLTLSTHDREKSTLSTQAPPKLMH
jgi:hypothetical protein